jgi:BirA family transcriptional regulator, biotin operon repressor / biotin---[acetyl-CoA-carboxylase] ligase
MREGAASDMLQNGTAHDYLSIEHIRRRLATDRVGTRIHLFTEVESTNETLRRLADGGAIEGTVVLAESQTAGRGRLGRRWFSPAGLNLYVSVLFRPLIHSSAVPVFSFVASLAVSDAVDAYGVTAKLKWPNDVLLGDRKVSGTLVAFTTKESFAHYVILGVGVNLNVDAVTLRRALGPPGAGATSLSEEAGQPVERNVFAARFLNHLESWSNAYRARGPHAVLAGWRRRDGVVGRRVEIREPDRSYRGTARGVTDAGRLLVETMDGARREVVTAEVVVLGHEMTAGAS